VRVHRNHGAHLTKLIEYRQLTSILAMFLIVQVAGLLMTFFFLSPAEIFVNTAQAGASQSGFAYALLLIAYIAVSGFVIAFFFKRMHGPLFYRSVEALAVGGGSFYFFWIAFAYFFPAYYIADAAASIICAGALVLAKNRWLQLQNFSAILASVGAGIFLGLSLSEYGGFLVTFVFLGFLAAYDYIAVFVTKHMVTLGREAVGRGLALLVSVSNVEVLPKGYLKAREEKEVGRQLKKMNNKTLLRLMRSGSVPVPTISALGAGDLMATLMIAVSAYVSFFSYFFSALLVLMMCLGIVFISYVAKRYRAFMPAIPPLFSFCSFAFGIYALMSATVSLILPLTLFLGGLAILVIVVLTAIRQSRKGAGAGLRPRGATSFRSSRS